MKYDVTRYSPGGFETVTVEAESGDEAAMLAYKPGCSVRGVTPSADQGEEPKRRGRPPVAAD